MYTEQTRFSGCIERLFLKLSLKKENNYSIRKYFVYNVYIFDLIKFVSKPWNKTVTFHSTEFIQIFTFIAFQKLLLVTIFY